MIKGIEKQLILKKKQKLNLKNKKEKRKIVLKLV